LRHRPQGEKPEAKARDTRRQRETCAARKGNQVSDRLAAFLEQALDSEKAIHTRCEHWLEELYALIDSLEVAA
jgi:hypothetical protein